MSDSTKGNLHALVVDSEPNVRECVAGVLKVEGWNVAQSASREEALGRADELGVKVGVLVHPARLACTGRAVGPSLYHLIEVLGRDRVMARLDRALARGFGLAG